MTIENDFLPFAVGGSANVVSQATYAGLSSLLANGFASGVAQSNELNKVWRQSSIMAAVLAAYVCQQTGQPAIDDGTTSTLLLNFTNAITATRGVIATVSVAGSADVTLTSTQYNSSILILTGALTGNIHLIFPASTGAWIVSNQTTGAFTLTCKITSGTTVAIAQSHNTAIWSDATNLASQRTDFSNIDMLAVSGTATVPTPTALDNSTLIATTAYVKTAGETFGAVTTVSTTGALTTAALGAVVQVTAGGTTQTFPAIASCPAGSTLTIQSQYAFGGTATTLAGHSAETIADAGGTAANTFSLAAAAEAQFVSDGTKWNLIGYSAGGSVGISINNLVITSSGTVSAAVGTRYVLTGSSAIAVTAPGSPVVGQKFAIKDLTGTQACTVNPNGSKIDNNATTMTINALGASLVFEYTGATYGWIIE